MKKLTTQIMMLLALFGMVACDTNDKTELLSESKPIPTPTPKPITISLTTEMEKEIATVDNTTAITIFSKVAKEEVGKKANFMLSPYSFNVAMAMLLNGAKGETKAEIEKALGYTPKLGAVLNEYHQKTKKTFLDADPNTKLGVANSIWYRENEKLKPEFQKNVTNYYDAYIQGVDFTNPSTKDIVNKWCADKTNNLIKEVLDETKGSDIIYLINALYFKGKWADGFKFPESGTFKGDFTLESGKKISVEMMRQDGILKIPYFNNEFFEGISLLYGNSAFSMLVLLPKQEKTVDEMVEELTKTGAFSQQLSSSEIKPVFLSLPKFKVDYDVDLIKTLKALGIQKAFTNNADFRNTFEKNVNFSVFKVKQFTYIDVNEEGTAAGAATVVGGKNGAAPPSDEIYFAVNRPFLFLIRENTTGSILFMGKVGNPNE